MTLSDIDLGGEIMCICHECSRLYGYGNDMPCVVDELKGRPTDFVASLVAEEIQKRANEIFRSAIKEQTDPQESA